MRRVRKLDGGGERRSWCCSEAVRFGARKRGADGKPIGCDASGVNERVLKYCVRYAVQHVQFHQERITQEILAEIKAVRQEKSPYDVEQLERDVKKQGEKWARAIELRVAGEITADELGRIREMSSRETTRLQEKIREAREFNKAQEQQAEAVEGYAEKVREILEGEDALTGGSEEFLGEVLEQVLVYQKQEVEVKLKAVPFSFRLRYVTSGKGESYAVKINHRERVWLE